MRQVDTFAGFYGDFSVPDLLHVSQIQELFDEGCVSGVETFISYKLSEKCVKAAFRLLEGIAERCGVFFDSLEAFFTGLFFFGEVATMWKLFCLTEFLQVIFRNQLN